jgi:hypothetical protein
MSDFYNGLATTATRLLTEYGKTSAYIRTTEILFTDDVAGTVEYAPPVDTAVQAAQTTYTKEYFEGQQVESDHRFFVLDAPANPDDELIVSGEVMSIEQSKIIQPGDVFVACIVMVNG